MIEILGGIVVSIPAWVKIFAHLRFCAFEKSFRLIIQKPQDFIVCLKNCMFLSLVFKLKKNRSEIALKNN